MGRPRNFDRAQIKDKVSQNIRESRSTNYTDGYLDGLGDGYSTGYDVGYDDGSTGNAHRAQRATTKHQ